jgi:hypothetical protein
MRYAIAVLVSFALGACAGWTIHAIRIRLLVGPLIDKMVADLLAHRESMAALESKGGR